MDPIRIAPTYYPDPEPLWPGGVPGWQDESAPADWVRPSTDRAARGVCGVDERVRTPTLHVYPAPAASATGAAVLIFPGGGFMHLAIDKEGYDVAAWLNTIGVTGIVVRYRTGPRMEHEQAGQAAEMDARRAVQWARANAERLHIDPSMIGVIGFSAGGQLAASVSTAWMDGDPDAPDAVARVSSRPDFCVLVYAGLRESHLAAISKDTPPAFAVQASDDLFPPDQAVEYTLRLQRAGVPAELHLFTEGGHGNGLGVWGGTMAAWPGLFANWLERLPAVKEEAAIRASGRLTSKSPLCQIVADADAKAILAEVAPSVVNGLAGRALGRISLAHLAAWYPDVYPEEMLRRLDAELAKL